MTASQPRKPFDGEALGAITARIAGAALDRKTKARLGRGDSQRSGQPVWRNSYYEGQIEERVWRPIAGGNKRAAARYLGALRKSAQSIERRTRRERQEKHPGTRNGVLGQVGLDVLEALCELVDYLTGRLDPAIATLAERTGYSYSAVHAALCRLRQHGFIHWMRRSKPVENPVPGGQVVEQISNAYALLVPEPLRGTLLRLFAKPPLPADEEWRRDQRKQELTDFLASLSAKQFLKATWEGDQLAGERLSRIAAALDRREASLGESSSNRETGGSY